IYFVSLDTDIFFCLLNLLCPFLSMIDTIIITIILTVIPYIIGFVDESPSIARPPKTTKALTRIAEKAAFDVVLFQNKPNTIGMKIEHANIAYATSIATSSSRKHKEKITAIIPITKVVVLDKSKNCLSDIFIKK